MADSKTILLTFEDKETAGFVRSVCRRKGIGLEGYILDNFEWDDMPECLHYSFTGKITHETCEDCEFNETCPDVVVGEQR